HTLTTQDVDGGPLQRCDSFDGPSTLLRRPRDDKPRGAGRNPHMKPLSSLRRTSLGVAAASCLAMGVAPAPLPAVTAYSPIVAMVDRVRAERLQATVEHLVAFGTRNDF